MWNGIFSTEQMYAKDANLVSSVVYGLLYLAVLAAGLYLYSSEIFSVWLSFSVTPFLNFDPASMSIGGPTIRFVFGQLMAFGFIYWVFLTVFDSLCPMFRLCRYKRQSFFNQGVL